MDISTYDYNLPKERVALYPANPRSRSKLLVIDRAKDEFDHKTFSDIIGYFKAGDVLVLNNSKVFPARIYGKKQGTGGKVEIFLLRKLGDEKWEALVRPGKRLQPGTIVEMAEGKIIARLGDRTDVGGRVVEFSANGDLMDLIWQYGEVPLPPYIAREPQEKDKATYQTIYAENIGAVAAPTAGFHFTDEIFDNLQSVGVETAYLTLHPGLGTFRPITVADAAEHKMEEEFFSIPDKTAKIINKARLEKRRVIAVGTTSVRSLESAYDEETGEVIPTTGRYTNKFIYPPYDYKVVDSLLTNFHLPKSTLLLLVSAIAGKDKVFKAYAEAVEKDYRFYSYGDAMLIL
ncbi:MAG: tRNA preQ1(34) S-adenosylmethionine ribosyltransferase-isomerase QueA [candidate division Zixibacteria bacterium]|nr:tRNA preQ1(34) S-adenosylmethionine ribosyltransferase-isomerase QueA [candidate division Zixibacteria bacterium]